jgi:hypothetical protein
MSRPSARYTSRSGISLNVEQQVSPELGLFLRAGLASGDVEPYEFSDIDRTIAAGLSLSGKLWGRPGDTVGIAGVINGISDKHKRSQCRWARHSGWRWKASASWPRVYRSKPQSRMPPDGRWLAPSIWRSVKRR